ncbi:MAG: mechanosensitive ion channel domain-containing protein [Rhodospirillales bacterium]
MKRPVVRLIAAAMLLWANLDGVLAETPADATPAKVQELLKLLDDDGVRGWIRARNAPAAASEDAAPPPAALASRRLAEIRQHLASLVAAVPSLPGALMGAADVLAGEVQNRGVAAVLGLIAVFAALGYGSERLVRLATADFRRWLDGIAVSSVDGRVRAITTRLGSEIVGVAAFAAGSIGAFLALAFPPLLTAVVLSYLAALVALRVALAFGRFLFAPAGRLAATGADLRVFPLSSDAARFWYRRLALFAFWLAFGWATLVALETLGLEIAARKVTAYLLGIGLLAVGLEAVWRRPDRPAGAGRSALSSRCAFSVLFSVYFALLWLLWVASAVALFWTAVVAAGLPALIGMSRRSILHLLRPVDPSDDRAAVPSVAAASLVHGVRALLIIAAAIYLAWVWRFDLVAISGGETTATRMLRSVLDAVVILLVADFAWHVLKAVIDVRLLKAQRVAEQDADEARRQARLRTLLPIVRNVLFVALIVMGGMMALSALGVEIGPLIAGAGVVGVAIGFGAQTLVKDIISGMFYLLDDAFRIGEYIQSDKYKGTVESFSLRSIKLRHQRGPLYTVPFGELGAVQNMSRDWVIDKLMVGVTFDSDIEKARKLIKQIGLDLAKDPEFAPHVLQPLKMQGIEQLGDFAIQLRMKIMTKPGEQFVIRRKAYALIKKAFDANGIKFAVPTVHVAGGGDESAAARRALDLVQKPQPS